MDQTTVVAGLEDVRCLVQADGGDMELIGADEASRTVRLRLVLDGASCHECVMPRPMLEDIAASILRRSVPDLAAVSIDDPREHPGYVSPDAH